MIKYYFDLKHEALIASVISFSKEPIVYHLHVVIFIDYDTPSVLRVYPDNRYAEIKYDRIFCLVL